MLAKLIDWSGRNRVLVLLATAFVVFAGVFAGGHLLSGIVA